MALHHIDDPLPCPSVICGAAPNMAAEIVGRVIAGVGGNGMYLGTLTLIMNHTLEKERAGYLASM